MRRDGPDVGDARYIESPWKCRTRLVVSYVHSFNTQSAQTALISGGSKIAIKSTVAMDFLETHRSRHSAPSSMILGLGKALC